MSAGLSGDMGVEDRPASHPPPPMGPLPQMMAGVFPLDTSVIDPALEQVLKVCNGIIVHNWFLLGSITAHTLNPLLVVLVERMILFLSSGQQHQTSIYTF